MDSKDVALELAEELVLSYAHKEEGYGTQDEYLDQVSGYELVPFSFVCFPIYQPKESKVSHLSRNIATIGMHLSRPSTTATQQGMGVFVGDLRIRIAEEED